MKIAVITPQHKTPKLWLEQCLCSVAEQTVPCTHFIVCDGDPSFDSSRFPQVEVFHLPKAHKDKGNAARAIGTVSAICQGFDAIAYLDSDNWYEPNHLQLLVAAQRQSGAAACSSTRMLFTHDNEFLGLCPEVDGEEFVDTNCLLLTRKAFGVVSNWYRMPRRLVEAGNRVIWHAIIKASLPRVHLSKATVNCRTNYLAHYRYFGKPAPANAKEVIVDVAAEIHGEQRPVTAAVESPPPVYAGMLPPRRREKISLCMIVKNEEHNIGDCLRPLVGRVDEVIVADTGSTDRTAEIARSLGATVVDFPWQDSFAAARNAALCHASGDWIMWLDADDRVDVENLKRLEKLFSRLPRQNVGFMMKQWSLPTPGMGSPLIVEHVRLFRRQPGVQWDYRVHEQILPSLERTKVRLVFTDIVIQHLGYQDPAFRIKKVERNLRLLKLEEKERPDDAFIQLNLAGIYQDLGQAEQVATALKRCLEVTAPGTSFLPQVYSRMSRNQFQLGQFKEALETCREGKRRFPQDPELWHEEGRICQAMKDHASAQCCFEHVLTMPLQPCFMPLESGVRGHLTRHSLALALRDQGKNREAEEQWLETIKEAPAFGPAWLGLAELYLQQQRLGDIEATIDRLRPNPTMKAIVAALRARVDLARKDYAAVQQVLEPVIAHEPTALWLRFLLVESLLAEGKRPEELEKHLRAILAIDPRQKQAKAWLSGLLRPEAAPSCAFTI